MARRRGAGRPPPACSGVSPTSSGGACRPRRRRSARGAWSRRRWPGSRDDVSMPNMKKSDASQGPSASELISRRIADLGGWKGETLGRMRALIKDADRDVVEEWKWVKATNPGTPVWSHDGIICTGEAYTKVVN